MKFNWKITNIHWNYHSIISIFSLTRIRMTANCLLRCKPGIQFLNYTLLFTVLCPFIYRKIRNFEFTVYICTCISYKLKSDYVIEYRYIPFLSSLFDVRNLTWCKYLLAFLYTTSPRKIIQSILTWLLCVPVLHFRLLQLKPRLFLFLQLHVDYNLANECFNAFIKLRNIVFF